MPNIPLHNIEDYYYYDENGNLIRKEQEEQEEQEETITYCPFCGSPSNEQHGVVHNGLAYVPCPNSLF